MAVSSLRVACASPSMVVTPACTSLVMSLPLTPSIVMDTSGVGPTIPSPSSSCASCCCCAVAIAKRVWRPVSADLLVGGVLLAVFGV